MTEKNTQSVARKDDADLASRIKDTLVPHVDICEDKDSVTLYADLPGVAKEGLDVHIDRDTLQIYGRRVPQADAGTGGNYTEMPARTTIGPLQSARRSTASISRPISQTVC